MMGRRSEDGVNSANVRMTLWFLRADRLRQKYCDAVELMRPQYVYGVNPEKSK